jgi:hypothetical protein
LHYIVNDSEYTELLTFTLGLFGTFILSPLLSPFMLLVLHFKLPLAKAHYALGMATAFCVLATMVMIPGIVITYSVIVWKLNILLPVGIVMLAVGLTLMITGGSLVLYFKTKRPEDNLREFIMAGELQE